MGVFSPITSFKAFGFMDKRRFISDLNLMPLKDIEQDIFFEMFSLIQNPIMLWSNTLSPTLNFTPSLRQ